MTASLSCTPLDEPVFVTRPWLPPFADYVSALEAVWESRHVTNRGPVVRRLEVRLADLLECEVSLFSSGGLALEVALGALGIGGEVITTPFTFPATANAILRCGGQPVFVDIEPDHLNIDPDRVERAVTPRTRAILAVHVFGNPARHEALAAIAERHGLMLVYDAAHAFGVRIAGRSIATLGDLSMFSLHATKPFHSVEGGALTYSNPAWRPRFEAFANHGLGADGLVDLPGTSAKLSDIHALMAELLLDGLTQRRAMMGVLEAQYRAALAGIEGINPLPLPAPEVERNHAFMPVLVDPAAFGMDADALKAALAALNVHVRRYFSPLLTQMAGFRAEGAMVAIPVAQAAAANVLALPIYADLDPAIVERICEFLRGLRR